MIDRHVKTALQDILHETLEEEEMLQLIEFITKPWAAENEILKAELAKFTPCVDGLYCQMCAHEMPLYHKDGE